MMSIYVVRNRNIILNYIFDNNCDSWTHHNSSLLILLIYTSMVFSYISPTFAVTINPTPIFVFTRFVSFLFFIIVATGKLMVELIGGGGVHNCGRN